MKRQSQRVVIVIGKDVGFIQITLDFGGKKEAEIRNDDGWKGNRN
jgi:hypothetical protein